MRKNDKILGYWVTYSDGSTAFYGAKSRGVRAWIGLAISIGGWRHGKARVVAVRALYAGAS